MTGELVHAPAATPEATVCRHHWIVEAPRGATSLGRCKHCGETREFRNSVTDSYWDTHSERLESWTASYLSRPREAELTLVGGSDPTDE